MTKQEIIEFLKEELRVEIDTEPVSCLDEKKWLNVRLFFGDEEISQSFISTNELR